MRLVWTFLPLTALSAALQFPLLALKRPQLLSLLSPSPPSTVTSSSDPSSIFTPHYFSQRISHDPSSEYYNQTFQQRYWLDTQFYKPGGPIYVLDGGETEGEDRFDFLERGILRRLSKDTGGIGIILEHRYYGASFPPFPSLSTDNLRFLDTWNSISDDAHFALNVELPFGIGQLHPNENFWLVYGGSYAGAKAGFVRKEFDSVYAGGIASSAVTHATNDFWWYFENIRLTAPQTCINYLTSHVETIDKVLSFKQPILTKALKGLFGLGDVTRDLDFVETLTAPLSGWQGGTWENGPKGGAFEKFCEEVVKNTDSDLTIDGSQLSQNIFSPSSSLEYLILSFSSHSDPKSSLISFKNYADYIKANIASRCPEDRTQDECFGPLSDEEYADDGLANTWRAWPWQVCNEWGYFFSGAPEGVPSLVSRLITIESQHEYCAKAFPPGKYHSIPEWPEVEKVNQYGDFLFEYDRLAFVDGDADPWLFATPHSPISPNGGVRDSTLNNPFLLIPNGRHHYDESGLLDEEAEPLEIQEVHLAEVEFVKGWIEQWKEEKALNK